MAVMDAKIGEISDAALGVRLAAAGYATNAGSTGSGSVVLATSPTLVTPALGTPASGTLTNCTGLPIAGSTGYGTGVATALAANVTGSGGIVLATGPAIAAGGSTGTIGIGGNITTQVSTAGVSPGGTGSDYVIATYTLPASAFDAAGREIKITGFGKFAANGNTKELKIYVGCTTATVGQAVSGGTAIADSGAVTANATGWRIVGRVLKYGAAASNTQIGMQDNSSTSVSIPQALTMTESAAIKIAITGNATTSASDIVLNGLLVEYAN